MAEKHRSVVRFRYAMFSHVILSQYLKTLWQNVILQVLTQ